MAKAYKEKYILLLPAPLAFMLSSYPGVCISCVNTQGMSELMKSWSLEDSGGKKRSEEETEQGSGAAVLGTASFRSQHEGTRILWT